MLVRDFEQRMEDRGVGRGKKRRQRRGGGKTSDLRPWLICLLAMMRMIRQKVWVFLIWLSPAGLVLKRVVFALLAWVCFRPQNSQSPLDLVLIDSFYLPIVSLTPFPLSVYVFMHCTVCSGGFCFSPHIPPPFP